MKIYKKINIFLIWLLCILCVPKFYYKANGSMDGQIVDGSVLTSEDEASDKRALIPMDILVVKLIHMELTCQMAVQL